MTQTITMTDAMEQAEVQGYADLDEFRTDLDDEIRWGTPGRRPRQIERLTELLAAVNRAINSGAILL